MTHPYTSFVHAHAYMLINSLDITDDYDGYTAELAIVSKCSYKSLVISPESLNDHVRYLPIGCMMHLEECRCRRPSTGCCGAQCMISFYLYDLFDRMKGRVDDDPRHCDLVIRILGYPEGRQGAVFERSDDGQLTLKLTNPDRVLAVHRCDLPVPEAMLFKGQPF